MAMATLQLYKNPYNYPDYGSITAYGSAMPCTPVGTGLKSGTIRVKGNMATFMNCNYLALTTDGKTIYAWIEDVTFRAEGNYNITYRVDPWRTFRDNITLGTQFIERSPVITDKFDDLLGASTDTPIIDKREFSFTSHMRVLIVQLRVVDGARFGYSSTPVQPTPYSFWAVSYNPTNWQLTNAITSLISTLSESGQSNVVTMYSIPWMSLSDFPDIDLPVVVGDEVTAIEGWKLIPNTDDVHANLTRKIAIPIDWINTNDFFRVEHSVQIVVPDAGIIDVPDQLIKKGSLKLRQDIDLFSGASNYMLEDGDGEIYTQSVRGSGVSSIPILSDVLDTYLSQNQNALTTSLIGDVASIGTGIWTATATGGIGTAIGAGLMSGGLNSIVSRTASMRDMKNMNGGGNPPAFLGTAMTGAFNSTYWIVATRSPVDNASQVHSSFGYVMNKVANLTFPTSGYIKTQGCNVSSDGSVPRWAIEEINMLFNNGILVN